MATLGRNHVPGALRARDRNKTPVISQPRLNENANSELFGYLAIISRFR